MAVQLVSRIRKPGSNRSCQHRFTSVSGRVNMVPPQFAKQGLSRGPYSQNQSQAIATFFLGVILCISPMGGINSLAFDTSAQLFVPAIVHSASFIRYKKWVWLAPLQSYWKLCPTFERLSLLVAPDDEHSMGQIVAKSNPPPPPKRL